MDMRGENAEYGGISKDGSQNRRASGIRRPVMLARCITSGWLNDIEKSAKTLIKRIEQLQRHPASSRAFWRSTVFGPVYFDRVEVREVLCLTSPNQHG